MIVSHCNGKVLPYVWKGLELREGMVSTVLVRVFILHTWTLKNHKPQPIFFTSHILKGLLSLVNGDRKGQETGPFYLEAAWKEL